MKRFKKISVALLGVALLATPTFVSCGNNEEGNKPVQVVVKSIAVTKMPTKVDYEVGDVFDPTGMEVTATMSDGTKQVVTDYTYSKLPLDTSNKSITISYKGKRTTVAINVVYVIKATSIQIDELPAKTKYVVGETFDPTGMKVVKIMNDNRKVVLDSKEYEYDNHNPLKATDTQIKITFEKLFTYVPITVEEVKTTGIEVTKQPNKVAYLAGETFDPTGMVISEVKNDGTKVELSNDKYQISKTDPLTLDDKEIVVTYGDFKVSVKISVSEVALTGLEIVSNPTKLEYWEGETLDLTGLSVKAKYSNNTEKILDNSELTISKTVLAKEDTSFDITFGGITKTIAIKVKEKVTSVKVDSLKTVRVEGEFLDTSNASLRPDFMAAGRTFIENGDNASNGQNICGYQPGSKFSIPVSSDKDFDIIIMARMSDTNLGYKINEGVKFTMNNDVLTADEPNFEYNGGNDYWHWKEFKVAKLSLKAGEHNFQLEAINQRPNIDYFEFKVVKYGEKEASKKVTGIKATSMPNKVTYEAGEKFDKTGLAIEATYDDYSKAVIEDYTIDKTGELKESDDKVVVTYGEFKIEIKITVGKAYNVKLNALGDKKFEAEEFDFSKLIHRNDMPDGFIVDNKEASGNKSIERYAEGSKVDISIYAAEELTTTITMVASNFERVNFDDVVKVKLDEKEITSDNPVLQTSAASQYYSWKNANFYDVKMAKGEHTLSLEFVGKPNFDYVNFFTTAFGTQKVEHNLESIEIVKNPAKTEYIVGEKFDATGLELAAKYTDRKVETITEGFTFDKTEALTLEDKEVTITYKDKTCVLPIKVKAGYDFEVTKVGTTRVEAEDFDLSTLVNTDGASYIENCGSFGSGEKSLGHIASGYLARTFNTNEEYTLEISMHLAKYEPTKVSQYIDKVEVDGNAVTFEDIDLGRTDGNDWFNFKEVKVTCGKIKAGAHTFKVTFKAGCNVDCFDFKFTK